MQIQRVSVSKIKPAPYNPRVDLQPGDPKYESLKRGIEQFGCVEPLVWNARSGNLVGGHQRFKILREQGAAEVDVSVVDLPEEQEKALNIALNKLDGEWDDAKLAALLDELTTLNEFDIELTGFDLPDANELIASVLHTNNEDKDEDFDVDAASRTDHPAVTKPGEVIELGRHRLLCGDCSRMADVRRVLGDGRADLLATDPPYGVNYYGGNRPMPEKARPKQSRQWQRIYNDNMTQAQYTRWLRRVLKNAAANLAPGGPFYIWNGHRQFGPMYTMLGDLGFKISCVITWAKESFAIGYGDYHQQTEFCLYGWLEENGAHNWYGPNNESTLWQVKREPTKSYLHPTQKPLELFERATRNSTRAGQTVFDGFLGSGTALIAAERTGRRCRGIEIEPHHCDVIVRRYIGFVGEDNVPAKLANRYRLSEVAGTGERQHD